MSSTDNPVPPKKYFRLEELASKSGLSVSELLNYAIERKLYVAIEEFSGYVPPDNEQVSDPPNSCDSSEAQSPAWAIVIPAEVLKNILIFGHATLEAGYQCSNKIPELVTFVKPRKVTTSDLIVLPQFAETFIKLHGLKNLPQEPDLSPSARSTLLKQIAALAILLSKEHGQFQNGTKPNSYRIALAIEQALAKWPEDKGVILAKDFFGKSKINDSIREGLELIGFTKDEKTQ